ncbi:xanthine dehydrogenase family protein molybdopterin-binding subunit [Tardiphaga sp. vice352]|uniref:xanthine dehydrogenase family protein molybdopterin-binding subunit n=1 Tax=unclassified Tardiphaga TaxID=2631404 RepID=UPI001164F94C|nr:MULTISPECIES: xanthine dehydrogenase family protein molybdopterin-binding subunit [unclassified Tardiphaga]QDM16647.1 xanthine dehydrogenase family protein molybdopterin-binding subunit [Tardiphaga sp. vice278]QDM21670.1 xanthine dehydrogenase family protein molybdopterin-binding subunit [Tardiphaga sp. vice154]QDM26855.1 xanthine dehydrogenase family protein molybdopterin-binding subunit [Tardiphaga sp. vice304]QDM31921.1 xanthine dehydrogenase family protein molybdopterin-binding subunit [
MNAPAKPKLIGQSVTRKEDGPLLRGQGLFAADVNFPNQLYMRVVRSTYAHGNILSVDLAPALAIPGVVAAWSFAEVADVPPIDFRLTKLEALAAYRQTILAKDRVRYVGDPVAVVFAENAYLAEDAAEHVVVEIEELPVILEADGPTGEFRDGLPTEPAVIRKGYGDVDAAFAKAHATVSLSLSIGRHSGVPLETRGAIGRYNAVKDVLEMYGAAKVPHWNRDQLATMFGRPQLSMNLFEGHVGGGFGIRGELYPEDVLVCLAALRLGRPVKWIEDRREHLIAANHSRQQTHHIRAAIDSEGHILAIDDEFYHDQGGYMRTHAATVPDLAAAMLPGPYRVPAYRAAGHIRLTNKTPGGTYRAPGRYESTFVRERLLDAIAAEIGIDTVEVRRRNLIDKSEMPVTRALETLGTHIVLDSGDYAGLLDKALNGVSWDALQADIKQRREAGELVGAGVAMFVEKSGLGPFDDVRITIDTTGHVEVVTGAASVGQGVETVIAQICADTLGVGYDQINVIHGQTNRIGRGLGAFASRVTVMTGEATRLAAIKLRDKVLTTAAELMQLPSGELDIVDGQIVQTGNAIGPSVGLGQIAAALAPGSKLLGDEAPGLSAEATFESAHMTYPYGVHVAVVSLARDTGGIDIERYLVAYDVGRAINPMLVEGQIVGGVAQGIGGALYEEFTYDDRGEPLAVTFADYLMPTAREVPDVDVIVSEDAPSPLNPMGVKGAGEGGTNAVGAALAAAIDDALQMPGAISQLPVSPQTIRALLRP